MHTLKIVMLGDSLNHQGGITTVQRLILKYRSPTLNICHITTHEDGTIAHRIKIFGRGITALIGHLLTQKVELVHIHIADGGSVLRKAIVALIAMLFRYPVVMHAHGPKFHLTYETLPAIAQQALGWFFQHCSQVIVLSQSWQDFYINHLDLDAKKVVILPNPIELPASQPNHFPALDQNAQELVVLFLGRVGNRKGTFDLIQAFSRLPLHQRNSLRLLIGGDGDLDKGKALVEQLQLVDRVSFLGWVDDNQRNALLAKADIFVLPSYNEALPMALLEAMAWGVPVITCPVGGIPDVVIANKNGLLVPPGDVQQLSEAMQSLVNTPSWRQKLGLEAQKSVTKFDVRHYVKKLENIYHACITACE